jgi:hypothetical protein
MEIKPGSRWKSAVCDTEVVAVRPPKSAVSLQCGGVEMIAHADAKPAGATLSADFSAGTQAGKRYADAETGIELLCSKTGKGSLAIDGRAILAADAKKLPASD